MEETIKVLIIEDNEERANELKTYLTHSELNIRISHYKNFSEGEESFSYEKFDIAIIDVKDDSPRGDDHAGVEIIINIMHNMFIPVIFWTGNPLEPIQEYLVSRGLDPNNDDNMVSLMSKTETANISSKIQDIITSRYFGVSKSIEHEISKILAEHLWKHVRPNYDEYFNGIKEEDIPKLQKSILRSRIIRKMSTDIDNTEVSGYAAWRYIYPPISSALSTGSILKSSNTHSNEWFIVLSPACNLEPRGNKGSAQIPKSEYLILAQAKPVEEYDFYNKYSQRLTKSAWDKYVDKKLKAKENWYYLPKFIGIPDLFVNLENIYTIQLNKEEYVARFKEDKQPFWNYFMETNSLEQIAALSSPYVENLISQYSHFVGKVGIPDLQVMNIMKH